MSTLHGYEKLTFRSGQPPPDRDFSQQLNEAYHLGLDHEDPNGFGLYSKSYGISSVLKKRLLELSGNNTGAHSALWAVFYQGLLDGRLQTERVHHWRCIVQQQLSSALFQLPERAAAELHDMYKLLHVRRDEWWRIFSGALGFARAAHALKSVGKLFLPKPQEDYKGKIDMLFKFPERQRGLCLQIKSDSTLDETTHVVIDQEKACKDSEGYLLRFLQGVEEFKTRHAGSWTPVLLIVGQRPEIDRHAVENCPTIAAGIKTMLAEFSKNTEPTL